MERMNMFTVLAGPAGGFGAVAAGGRVGEAGRRQRLTGVHDPGGQHRRLFGVGEGPTEAVAEAKQERLVGFDRGSGWLPPLGWASGILDRSCKCSYTLVCQNRVPTILIWYSSRPRRVLRASS
jgi:hypothetical protein